MITMVVDSAAGTHSLYVDGELNQKRARIPGSVTTTERKASNRSRKLMMSTNPTMIGV